MAQNDVVFRKSKAQGSGIIYKCEICGKSFPTKIHFDVHVLEHKLCHKTTLGYCKTCLKPHVGEQGLSLYKLEGKVHFHTMDGKTGPFRQQKLTPTLTHLLRS